MLGASFDPNPAPRPDRLAGRPPRLRTVLRAIGTAASAGTALAGAAGEGRAPAVAAPPGARSYTPTLSRELAVRLASFGESYRPRTRHLTADGSPLYTNRLVRESSRYLRQHAHNPVDWYPWGDEAFDTAGRLGRPVLLSIG